MDIQSQMVSLHSQKITNFFYYQNCCLIVIQIKVLFVNYKEIHYEDVEQVDGLFNVLVSRVK